VHWFWCAQPCAKTKGLLHVGFARLTSVAFKWKCRNLCILCCFQIYIKIYALQLICEERIYYTHECNYVKWVHGKMSGLITPRLDVVMYCMSPCGTSGTFCVERKRRRENAAAHPAANGKPTLVSRTQNMHMAPAGSTKLHAFIWNGLDFGKCWLGPTTICFPQAVHVLTKIANASLKAISLFITTLSGLHDSLEPDSLHLLVKTLFQSSLFWVFGVPHQDSFQIC